ncbi:MAG: signal peptidase I [Erysipelotrichaceae bacterium]|nr:signal peptidase I [Erysipelotrichaceae bacterium]MDY6035645.1 signal peptidase I [Bulleidia sp.]
MNIDKEELGETRVMEQLTDDTTPSQDLKSDTEPKKKKPEENGVLSFFKDILISFLIVFVLVNFIVRPIQVKGRSMYNTLEDGYFGFSNLIGYRLGGLKRFDIVIVYLPEKDEYIIKRVIGMPGETVEYHNNQLFINGEQMDEPFLDQSYVDSYDGQFTGDFTSEKLGDDEYFCMGDNRPHSSDSRFYGAFKKKNIMSKGAFIIYPFNGFGVYTW